MFAYYECLEESANGRPYKGDTLMDYEVVDMVEDCIDSAPPADVVEVKCRCSECKHLKIINKEPVYAECEREKLTFLLWQADTREHFCSHGERRTDDGNL